MILRIFIGVLLLNAGLTVRSGAANSHKDKGWETLTDAVIQWISNNCQGVVFLLWGAYASKKALVVDKVKIILIYLRLNFKLIFFK
jgi:uracil-DNA glycosylase